MHKQTCSFAEPEAKIHSYIHIHIHVYNDRYIYIDIYITCIHLTNIS